MPSSRLRCPECDARLSVPASLPAGKRIRCGSCGIRFAPADAETDDEEDEYGDRPRRRRPRKKKNRVLWIVLASVGFLFVLCVGGIVWLIRAGLGPTTFPEQTEDYAQ